MRRTLIFFCSLLILVSGAYIASPLWAAWSLREAIRGGDTATVRTMIDWPRVRRSLRRSLARQADILPARYRSRPRARRSMWQSIKAMFARPMLDRFIDRYVTPEGLPQLFQMNAEYRQRIRGQIREAARPWRARLQSFVSRLKRAEFTTLTTFVLELRDRNRPERVYLSVFQLEGWAWRLVTLKVLKQPISSPANGIIAHAL